jgi:hypothetical protein
MSGVATDSPTGRSPRLWRTDIWYQSDNGTVFRVLAGELPQRVAGTENHVGQVELADGTTGALTWGPGTRPRPSLAVRCWSWIAKAVRP